MRDYAKISPSFWIGKTGRQLRKESAQTKVIATYLITSPHANMLGLYYLPVSTIAHETGSPLEGASKGLARLSSIGFAYYDPETEFIFVPAMAKYQIGELLSEKDKRSIGVQKEYNSLPDNPFLFDFWQRYAEHFHIKEPRGFEGASKGLRSQEQEQEQEQEQDQEKEQEHSKSRRASATPGHKEAVEYFCTEYEKWCGNKYRFLGGKDAKLVKELLGTYGLDGFKKITDQLFRTTDSWIVGTGRDIGILSSQANKLMQECSGKMAPLSNLSRAGRVTALNAVEVLEERRRARAEKETKQ